MLDIFNFSNNPLAEQIFTGGTAPGANATTNFWHCWKKPKGARFVSFYCVGAGAGGGKGLTNSAGTSRGGGGGGGSGAIVRACFIASQLPDMLWIQTPTGGKGADSTAAVAGGRVWISVSPSISANATLIVSSAADAGIGAVGTTSGGAGGSAATIAVLTAAAFGSLAISWIPIAGVAGVSGGTAGSAGTAANALSTIPLTGGSGGGSVNTSNTSFAGGNITGAGIVPTIAGGANTGATGNTGFYLAQPWVTTGGSGGGGLNGTGGNGGDGAYGSGGGGGGAGTTAGNGGTGGDSIVIVTCI